MKHIRFRLFNFVLFTCLSLSSLLAYAKTEYVVGLAEQSIRAATVEELEQGFNYQLEAITKNQDYLLKVKVVPNNEQLMQLLMQSKFAGYFGSPKLFIENKSIFNPDLLFSPVIGGKVMGRYVLLVRKDSGISSLESAKNTTLSYCAADEVGIFFLQKLFKDKKLPQFEKYFKKVAIKKNPNLNVSAVFFKESQVALVLESDFVVAAELNPQLKIQLVAIETSPEYVINLTAVSNKLSGPMTSADLQNNVLRLSTSINNKSFIRANNYGAMRKIKLEDLNSVRDLINSINENKGNP